MKITIVSRNPIPIDVRTWDEPNADPIFKSMDVEFLINDIFKCSCVMPFMAIEDAPKAIETKIMEINEKTLEIIN